MGFLKKKEPAPQEQDPVLLDIDIASGIGAKMISTPQAVKILADAFQNPNAVKHVAMFMAQLVEKIQEKSMETDIPLDPSIWFMDDGVMDELGDELSDIAERVGVEFTPDMMDEIKTETLRIGMKRAEQEGGEEGAEAPADPESAEAPMEAPMEEETMGGV